MAKMSSLRRQPVPEPSCFRDSPNVLGLFFSQVFLWVQEESIHKFSAYQGKKHPRKKIFFVCLLVLFFVFKYGHQEKQKNRSYSGLRSTVWKIYEGLLSFSFLFVFSQVLSRRTEYTFQRPLMVGQHLGSRYQNRQLADSFPELRKQRGVQTQTQGKC